MLDITKILEPLAKRRPLFHSEADFQHAFAWEIHKQFPEISLRLEYPFAAECHLDIFVDQGNEPVAIELKYKTRDLFVKIGNEEFTLKGHSAQDCGRYDFIKDIERLEQAIAKNTSKAGYALLLTNDSAYWKEPRDVETIDRNFRIHDGRILRDKLSWDKKASKGTTRGREKALELKGKYSVRWEDYSCQNNLPYGLFRYLLITVGD